MEALRPSGLNRIIQSSFPVTALLVSADEGPEETAVMIDVCPETHPGVFV